MAGGEVDKPSESPDNPNFSSGPCSKRPGWSLESLKNTILGRSHRSNISKARLKEVIEKSRRVLELPDHYKLGIVPASDTGAIEMALWSVLGARGVDVLVWESFGASWASDIKNQLKIKKCRIIESDYGSIPDLTQVDFNKDIVFTWNGTTSGVCVPNGDWISESRKGLTICDATSAVFGMEIPWEKLDIVTYSWQKALGGEAQHGIIVLSDRAVERLESFNPKWPVPKVFRLTKDGKLLRGIFNGETTNTPSMLAVEDALDGLNWAIEIGSLSGLIARTKANFRAIEDWVSVNPDIEFLAERHEIRSSTSVCLKIVASWFLILPREMQIIAVKETCALLEELNVAYDIGAYRDAPAGLRIWAGATINTSDLKKLFPWITWGLDQTRSKFSTNS